MLPACCLPLWGREGVTLLAAAENYRMTGKKGFNRAKNRTLIALPELRQHPEQIRQHNPDAAG
jgi:hypothetical protein